MNAKTCGECRFYNEDFNLCLHWRYGDITKSSGICNRFAPITNGDRIRQGGDEALMLFKKKHKCDCCAYAAPIDTAPACRRPEGKVCYDGMLAWLNSPAESQLNDAIQNVIKDEAKNAIDIHEAAYAPDMNDATKESEGEDD